ncbi:MAG: hypothetical protein CML20_10110 [Rheinheimera sp.]|uniref:hypothetical protein n=1 Tax=Arsukibacterium sp. UBA3155 TaxID=1946058 RepID=UPI000C92E1EA|nr:hypothetical protein [Arsukibacterium sp. UBA3155]MAD75126.1 hypothetical protein [Rheinheimera sp.]|tara:strand:+ start:54073 stop:54435 length:363 start_codon:yes stop_codon:yes gene_type:complete
MFAVFGISYEKARAKAIKLTKKTTGKGKELRQLTQAEYDEALNAATEKYMQQMKPVILSGEFSQPSVCQQFIAMAAEKGASQLQVMIKAPVQTKDKKGRAKVSKRWMEYSSTKDYTLGAE